MLLKKNNRLVLNDFTGPIRMSSDKQAPSSANARFSVNLNADDNKNLLHEAQIRMIEQALKITSNNVTQAAGLLGIPRTTLNHYIRRFNISK